MNNQWVQIIGTFLIGGALLNWILPLYFSIFGMRIEQDKVNEICLVLGGKIHRKWFFLNNLIFFAALLILLLLSFVFKNWVMILILLPYFLALFVLNWNNVYKRINAIFDNHIFAIWLTCIMAIFCIFSKWLYSKFPSIEICIDVIMVIFWLLLFVLPTKKNNS